MRINTNANSNSAWTSYTNNQDKLKQSMGRLSTGVIQATDDPAGLGISERMRAQNKGTEMARFNTDNAISLVQTADSWLQKVNDMLSRMKSLSVEAEGIMSQTDKDNLQVEFESMQDEITRITSRDTAAGKFNGLYMFRGGNGTTGANDSAKTTGGIPAQAAGQQQVTASVGASSMIAMAGGGYVVSSTAIDGQNAGVQLFDDDGNKLAGPNVSVAGITNITALKTGGFIAEGSTSGTLQKYDRYGDTDGGEIALEGTIADLVDGTTSITALENGNVLVSDGNEVQLVDFNAELSADKVVMVVDNLGTNGEVAAFNTGEFVVYNDTADEISRYDAAGEEIASFNQVDATTIFSDATASIDQVVTLKDGGFLAIDTDTREMQKFNADGSKVGDLITFESGVSVGGVTALNDGGFVVANTKDTTGDSTNNALLLTRFSEDGSEFEEIQVNNGRNIGDVSAVDVAVLANGDFVVEFTQDDDAGNEVSYSKKFEMESGIRLQIGADLNQALTLELPDLQVTNHQIIGSFAKTTYDNDNNVTGSTSTDVRWSDIIDKNKLNVESDDIIGKLDEAINFVSTSRASIAAQQNRLQNTKEGLLAYQDNLMAAESNIRDVDMAKESINFSSTQIKTNASNAILAQANGLPNSVLQLLG